VTPWYVWGRHNALCSTASRSSLSDILAATESPEQVIRDAIDWSVDNPQYAIRVLSVLTRIADAEQRRHMVTLVNERIEVLAEAAAGSGWFESTLVAFIDKVRPETGKKTVQEWRAAIRRAKGVEPIRFGGLADRRARTDQLDRESLISAPGGHDEAAPPRGRSRGRHRAVRHRGRRALGCRQDVRDGHRAGSA
jgi:hypothetical protein